jgi:hypothetical protein
MRVTLKTACGCERTLEFVRDAPRPVIVIALRLPRPTVMHEASGELLDPGSTIRTRRFVVSKYDPTVYEEDLDDA